jgi:HSP20 family molecular chaperone IbpA
VTLPTVRDGQRTALQKAAAARRARAELKDRLKRGGTNLQQVLKDAETNEVLGKMKVSALLEALPKVGKVKAQEIMTELEIAPTRRLRGLGDRQRKALLEKFDGDALGDRRPARREDALPAAPRSASVSVTEPSAPAQGRPTSERFTHGSAPRAELNELRGGFIVSPRFSVDASTGAIRPATEIVKDGDDALLRVELPGVDVDQDLSVDVDKGFLTIRLPGAARGRSTSTEISDIETSARIDEKVATVPVELLEMLTAAAAAQLDVLQKIETVASLQRRQRVELDTPTGTLEYTLPISLDETYSSAEVSAILSPSGKGHRSIAQHRRRAHAMLGIKVGNQYRYPKFQVDPVHHEIYEIVKYANQCLECDADPWGTLDWWYSEDEAMDGHRPVDMLASGELTEELVDFAVGIAQQGMD